LPDDYKTIFKKKKAQRANPQEDLKHTSNQPVKGFTLQERKIAGTLKNGG